jgi:hypothetical protein
MRRASLSFFAGCAVESEESVRLLLVEDDSTLLCDGRFSAERDLLVLGRSFLIGLAGASDLAYLRVLSMPSTELPESSSASSA